MNGHSSRASLPRCAAVWGVVTAGTIALLAVFLPDLGGLAPDDLRTATFDAVLVRLAEAALLCCAAWLWAVTPVWAAQACRGRPARETRAVPAVVRRVVLAACGVALAGALALPPGATPG